jgi:HAE1 family hydrophobic/amphiphilic exporter-1
MEKRFGLGNIGGLISSLFLTLIIVPVIYEIMEKLVAKFSKGEKIDYEKKWLLIMTTSS